MWTCTCQRYQQCFCRLLLLLIYYYWFVNIDNGVISSIKRTTDVDNAVIKMCRVNILFFENVIRDIYCLEECFF